MLSRIKSREYRKAVAERLAGKSPDGPLPEGGKTQSLFVRALFTLMGRLAKLDGRVSEEEIQFTTSVMRQLSLSPHQRQSAIDCFYLGKLEATNVMPLVEQLASNLGRGSELSRQYLKTLCELTYSKGSIRLREKLLLREIAENMGFSKAQLLTICTEIQVSRGSHFVYKGGLISQAYHILNLAPDADDCEIRRAYRRMMTRCHPDKLAARPDSGDAVRQAQEQFMAVRHAYETICGFRKTVNL